MAETVATFPNATQVETIARVELFTDAALPSSQWRLVYHFETGIYDANGALVSPTNFGSTRVERLFGAIINDLIDDGAGHTATAAQIAAWVKAGGYKYLAEDKINPPLSIPGAPQPA